MVAGDGLTFNALRRANVLRLPLFKNKHGKAAHSEPDGSDWSLDQWATAVGGEWGEFLNLLKKFSRGDITIAEFQELGGKELADVVTYLDILAFRMGINLGGATKDKWNEVSARVDCDLRLHSTGQYVYNIETEGNNGKETEAYEAASEVEPSRTF